tara:strand:- start:53381 stop:54031 length:651 start_codon:yes stop_codon:yes gene_type:complete
MRNLILGCLALFMTVAVSAQNYSYFDNDVRFYDEGEAVVTLTHFGVFPITEKFGVADYASIEGNNEYSYGQVLIGGYYQITPELSVYLLAGKEGGQNLGLTNGKVKFGGMLYYTTGDKIRAYAFYTRNGDPFASNTKNSEWYDFMARYALVSKTKNSVYVGARFMKMYGLGPTVSVRQAMSKTSNAYLGFTMYNDVSDDYSDGDWTPTLTLAIEFN